MLRKLSTSERSLWLIAFGLFLFWTVDSWFARVITQYENHNANIEAEQHQKSDSFDKRPILVTVRAIGVTVWHWLHASHHEILSAFTIGLFGVTAALAWYTKELAGRTPGFIKRVSWNILPIAKLKPIPEYDWTVAYQILHPDQVSTATKAPGIRYEKLNDGWAVYGRVDYEDVFRDPHSSGFLYRIEWVQHEGYQHFPIEDFPAYWDWT